VSALAIVCGVRGLACIAALCGVAVTLGSSTALAAPTKGQFIRQGDVLCASAARELAPIAERAQASKSLPDAKRWATAAELWAAQIRIQIRFNTRFRAIGVPAGDATARRLVSGMDRGLILARAVRDAVAARSNARLATAAPAYVRFTVNLNRRVQAYGFRVCGRS
jgi:hypothetical protein